MSRHPISAKSGLETRERWSDSYPASKALPLSEQLVRNFDH
jgi:hypothetical protein